MGSAGWSGLSACAWEEEIFIGYFLESSSFKLSSGSDRESAWRLINLVGLVGLVDLHFLATVAVRIMDDPFEHLKIVISS